MIQKTKFTILTQSWLVKIYIRPVLYHVHIYIYNVIPTRKIMKTLINLEKIILKDCLLREANNKKSMEGRNYTLWKVEKL